MDDYRTYCGLICFSEEDKKSATKIPIETVVTTESSKHVSHRQKKTNKSHNISNSISSEARPLG